MHSHHSHSGQYCNHAKDSLDEVVRAAIERDLRVFCLTEHVPRLDEAHLYPEEIEANCTPESLKNTFREYYAEACALKTKYAGKIKLLVGFESEALNDIHFKYTQQVLKKFKFDMFVGSVHHVDEIPIDFDRELWNKAATNVGGVGALYGKYFDLQYEMIKELKPTVIGHFDLIRLMSPEYDLRGSPNWDKVVRNIKLGVANGCMFEINTAAIRKGWSTPYPQRDVADAIIENGGKFCLSDDSHGVAQVALNYDKALPYIESLGQNLYCADGSQIDPATFRSWVEKNYT